MTSDRELATAPRRGWRGRAPVRLDLAGGWTDVPPFRDREGGAVLSAAINRYAYVSALSRDDELVRLVSADYDVSVEHWLDGGLPYDGCLDMPKAALRRLNVGCGVELLSRCEAPPGSGLGSSASMGVALVGTIGSLAGTHMAPHQVASLACELEQAELGIPGGKQDQYGAALGGVNLLEFNGHAVFGSALRLSRNTVWELEKRLVLCYTGQSRLSGNIIARVMDNYVAGRASTTGALRRMRELAFALKDMLLMGSLNGVGELVLENWNCQLELDPSITNATITELMDIALHSGAEGGKALGAGGGGCVLFVARPDQEHRLRKAIESKGMKPIDFNLDFEGLATWAV